MDEDLSYHFCRIGVFRRVGGCLVIGFVFFIIKFLRFFFFVLHLTFSVGLAVGWVLGLFFYIKIFEIFFFRVAKSIFRRVVDWLVFDKKITTRSIPMWSPTIVLTAPSPA